MYCPANNHGVASKLINGEIKGLTSICLCLEDSIADEGLKSAEQELGRTLRLIKECESKNLPLIFIRPRNPEHLARIYEQNRNYMSKVTGFVLPKFDLTNAYEYLTEIEKFNSENKHFYVMPTLESTTVADIQGRAERLCTIKKILDEHKECVLNVRVGGNDFANIFGLRRNVRQNVYQMGVIQSILTDVLNVFSRDYVVSGPVWEFFGEDADGEWARGLKKELELDMLNGFIGKTVIHPTQIPIVLEGMKVDVKDYEDAKEIINWKSGVSGVAKSVSNSRMNEVKTHTKWAKKICLLGDIYGVKGDL